jgi:phage host-nuclease inhibitor protein Gam
MATKDTLEDLDYLMSELTDVDHNLSDLTTESERRHKEITDEFAPKIDPLTARRKELVDQIAQIFDANRKKILSGGKTAVLRNGTLSARFSPGKIEITDEDAAMRYTRAHRMLKAVTKVGKRTFVKANLKKYLDFVEKCPGITFEQPENLLINLARTHVEIVADLHPLRRQLS